MDTFISGVHAEFRPKNMVYFPVLRELLDKMNPFISIRKGLEIFSSAGTPYIQVYDDEIQIQFMGGSDFSEEDLSVLTEHSWIEDDAGVWHRWL